MEKDMPDEIYAHKTWGENMCYTTCKEQSCEKDIKYYSDTKYKALEERCERLEDILKNDVVSLLEQNRCAVWDACYGESIDYNYADKIDKQIDNTLQAIKVVSDESS